MLHPDLPELALSVRQPWAWALIHALPRKDMENRGQHTARAVEHALPEGSRFCVHAAAGMTRAEYQHAAEFMASTFGIKVPPPAELVRGAIIGTVTFNGVTRERDLPDSKWFFGPYALQVSDAVAVEPVRVTGALGLFHWRKQLSAIAAPTALDTPQWMKKWPPEPMLFAMDDSKVCRLSNDGVFTHIVVNGFPGALCGLIPRRTETAWVELEANHPVSCTTCIAGAVRLEFRKKKRTLRLMPVTAASGGLFDA